MLSHFRTLADQYTTWAELSTYLQSKEGGFLRIIEIPSEKLAIVRYVKGVSDMNCEHVRLFRSVVWNTQTNRPVCVSPVKAEATKVRPPSGGKFWVSEFVDGVMMNVFRVNDKIHISTRTSLGANNTFYTNKTFADMFKEATPSDIDWKTILQPNQFVSCVLQHPDHKVVAHMRQARLVVTHVGRVEDNGNVVVHVVPSEWPTSLRGLAPFHFSNYDVSCMMMPTFRSYKTKGHVIQDLHSYHRYRIMNEEYEKVRSLRGSESDSRLRFLRLRKNGDVKQYLQYFKEESKEMWELEQLFRQKTHELYEAYSDVNKRKSKTMKDIPIPFRTHVYELQGEYLKTLPNPVPVRKETVITRINGLSAEEQLKVLNAV